MLRPSSLSPLPLLLLGCTLLLGAGFPVLAFLPPLPEHLNPHTLVRELGMDNYTRISTNPISNCPKYPVGNPANVRDLRPADIKVVLGVGDSITAGFAITGLPVETREESWSIGGASGAIAIANFLRHFNPNVIGYSVGLDAGLNTAVSGALVSGIKGQLQEAVRRMKADSRINFQQDWKLVNILIGANNFCKSCNKEARHQPDAFLAEMRSALDWAHQNIPKALISLNGMLPLSTLKTAGDKDQHCLSIRFITATLCPCAFNSEGDARWMDNVVSAANRHQQELAREWDKKGIADFNVVYQPGLSRTAIPNTTYLSKFDCFHPTLKAHQEIAVGEWNQLLTPVGRKPDNLDLPPKLQCPTKDTLLYSRA